MAIRKYFRKLRNDAKDKMAQIEALFARPADSPKPPRTIRLMTTAPFLKYHRGPDLTNSSLLTIRNPDSSDNFSTGTTLGSSPPSYHSADEILIDTFPTSAHDMLSSSNTPSLSLTHSSFETALPSASSNSYEEGLDITHAEIRSLFQSPLTQLTRAIRAGTFPPNTSAPPSPIAQTVLFLLDQNGEPPASTALFNPHEALRHRMAHLLANRASPAHPIFFRKRVACPTWRTSSSKRRALLTDRDLCSRASTPRSRASTPRTRASTPRTTTSAPRPRIPNAIPTVVVTPPAQSAAEEAPSPSSVPGFEPLSSRLLRALPTYLFRNPAPAPAPAPAPTPAPIEPTRASFLPDCSRFAFTFTAPLVPSASPSPPSSPSHPHERVRESPTRDPSVVSSPEEDFYRCQALCEVKFAEIERLSRRLNEVVGELQELL